MKCKKAIIMLVIGAVSIASGLIANLYLDTYVLTLCVPGFVLVHMAMRCEKQHENKQNGGVEDERI